MDYAMTKTEFDFKQNFIRKIAVFNPYLQGGHIHTAEMESIARFITAAKRFGIHVGVFSNSEDIDEYNPDLVFLITYQVGKLTKHPTYLSVNIPVPMIKNVPRFVRNILSVDALLTVSPSVVTWLIELCHLANKKIHIGEGYFTVPETNYEECDFTHACAMYMGTNWDGLRHQKLFQQLDTGHYLKCYGPSKNWSYYAKSLYGGEIAFDGVTSLMTYRKHGAGLCIGHPLFDREGIANNRMFEIVAASAVAICSPNELTKTMYGDTVLYLDNHVAADKLAKQIVSSVTWIRKNAQKAAEMAQAAHAIFQQKYSMECFIVKLIDMHQKVVIENGYKRLEEMQGSQPVAAMVKAESKKVCYLILSEYLDQNVLPILKDLSRQTHSTIEIALLTKSSPAKLKVLFKEFDLDALKITYFNQRECALYDQLLNFFLQTDSQWIGFVSDSNRLFPHHTITMMEAYVRAMSRKLSPVSAIFSGNLEFSYYGHLPEKMIDEHPIECKNGARIAHSEFNYTVPLGNLLIKTTILNADLLRKIIEEHDRANVYKDIEDLGIIINTAEITCSMLATPIRTSSQDLVVQDLLLEQVIILKKQVVVLTNRLNTMLDSRSWVMTKPFRKLFRIGRWIKKSFVKTY